MQQEPVVTHWQDFEDLREDDEILLDLFGPTTFRRNGTISYPRLTTSLRAVKRPRASSAADSPPAPKSCCALRPERLGGRSPHQSFPALLPHSHRSPRTRCAVSAHKPSPWYQGKRDSPRR